MNSKLDWLPRDDEIKDRAIVAVVFTAVGDKAFCTGGKPHRNAAARLRKVMIPLTSNVRDQRLPSIAVDRAVRAPHHPDQVP